MRGYGIASFLCLDWVRYGAKVISNRFSLYVGLLARLSILMLLQTHTPRSVDTREAMMQMV